MQARILIVDDDHDILTSLTKRLTWMGHDVLTAEDGEQALKMVVEDQPDLMLLDIGLPGKNGMDVLRDARDLCPDMLVVMITAHEDVSMAVSAMRLGAYDYIVKPLYLESIELTVRKALETIRLRREVKILQEKHLIENVPFFI